MYLFLRIHMAPLNEEFCCACLQVTALGPGGEPVQNSDVTTTTFNQLVRMSVGERNGRILASTRTMALILQTFKSYGISMLDSLVPSGTIALLETRRSNHLCFVVM